MTERLVIIGGGGMGRCVLDVVDAVNERSGRKPRFEVVGVVDDRSPSDELLADRGCAYLGPIERMHEQAGDVAYVIGIASTTARRTIDRTLLKSGRTSPVLVHPNVHLGHDVDLGPGTVLCSHVSVENHVRLGRHVHVNQNSTIGHDVVLNDYCTISPLVAVSGNVTLEDSVFVGSGASIRQGLTLSRAATVGMGAAVVKDVAEDSTVVGVPAAPLE